MSLNWKTFVPIAAFILVLIMPTSAFMMPGLTVIEQRVIAIFLLAALCWMFEPIPIYATSIVVIALELFLISDKSFSFAQMGAGVTADTFGVQLKYATIMATLADPIIILFLGGFFLAMAATKYRLDVNLARVLLKPFGQNPKNVMLGLMVITAIFSMFMSNTATTAMMLAVLTPVLASLPEGDRGRTAFALAIPTGANIGGIGTPIGTPPNAVAMNYLVGDNAISFGGWMAFAIPYVIILIAIAWVLLYTLFPSKEKKVVLELSGAFLKTPKAIIVYITFIVTVGMWMLGELFKINSNVVAIIPVAVFLATKVITRDDLKKISWDVLWLVSGGLALGLALDKTGLAKRLVESIPFDSMSPIWVILGAVSLSLMMANFMSHTVTANLLLPLMAVLAGSMAGLADLGGAKTLILTVTFAASLGMSLPISTPPNALAHATGMIETKQMALVGVILGVGGVILSLMMILSLSKMGWM